MSRTSITNGIVFVRRRLARTLATAGLLTLLPVSLAQAGVQQEPLKAGPFGIAGGRRFA